MQLIEQLQLAGHHNTVFVLTGCGSLRKRLTASGAALLEMWFRRGRVPVAGLGRMAAAFKAAKPDVVQGWMYHGNLAASVLRLISGVRAPLVWSIHNSVEPMPEFPLISRVALRSNRTLSRWPEKIVYVSAASARQHERIGFKSDRTLVIPNGTDCSRFFPEPKENRRLHEELGVPPHVPLVGLFARWDPVKGHSVLFAAAARLLASELPLHLVLAGTGVNWDNSDLVSALGSYGLIRHCSCLGQRPDIDALMRGLGAFALSSVNCEAFPLVLGEAMASGVLCIATDVGDSRLILGKTGEIVPPGNSIALANALERLLLAEPGERALLGKHARMRIEEHFSLDRMVQAYAALYSNLAPGAVDDRDGLVASRA